LLWRLGHDRGQGRPCCSGGLRGNAIERLTDEIVALNKSGEIIGSKSHGKGPLALIPDVMGIGSLG